ncbi:hypothetical protein CY35_01G049700 [Sphagnum magellanicum]|nr:hypothetical protein CY35_01G049700 [Sphagnum magellanicum]
MVSIRRRLNTWESVKSVGLDLLVEAKNQKKLNDCRRTVQPLLNALRFVESSNHLHCPDGDNGLSIGPLQISELYHLDAWKHKKAYAWILCRDLEHAENTVIAYWLKYCPDALVRGDWETLAKVHNGGPQGCAMAKTVCYWSKVSSHLQQHEPNVIKKLSQLDRKRVLAVIKSDKPVILSTANRGSTLHHKRKLQRSAKVRLHRVAGSRQISSRSSDSKQLSPFIVHRVKSRQLTTNVSSKHTSLQSMLHFGYWTFPQSAKQHQAAILLQAFWRMHVARLWYQRVQRVVLLIQKWWRQCLSQKAQGAIMILANSGIEKDQEILDEHRAQTDAHQRICPSLDAMTGDPSRLPEEPGDAGGCLLEMPRSPVDSLYDINISEKRKDEILTELATSFFLAPEGDRFSRNPTGDKSMELFHTTDIDNVADMENINSAFSLALSADALSFSFPQLPDEKLKDRGPTVLSSPLQVWNQTVLETGTIPPMIDGREPTSVDLCGSPTETVKIFPSVALKGNHLEEWPLSPTRERISVAAGSCKLSPSWKIQVPIKGKCDDNLPQSGRRCQDLGQVDIPSSWWNSTEVKSMSAHGDRIQAPSHNAKKLLGATGRFECFPVSAGLLAGESERCFGLIPQIDDVSASSDIGVGLMTPPCNRTPLVGHTCEVESPLSPAMEEELLEELAKLLHTGANALSSSGTTNLQASAPRLTGTLDSCSVSQATVQIKGNSRKPARKLYFHVGKEDKLQEITANGLPQYTAGGKLSASSVGHHTTCAQESDSNKMLEDNTRCNVTQTSLAVSQPSIVALQSECELLQKNKLLETAVGMYELKGSLQPVRDGHQNTRELNDRFQNHSDGISESLSPLPEACSSKNPWAPNNPWSHSYHRPTSHREIEAVYGEVPVKTTEQHDGSSVLVADVRPGTSLVPSLSRWQEIPNIESECSRSILANSMVSAPSDQFYARIDSQPDCNSHKHGEEQPQISSQRQLSSAKTASDVDQTSRSNEDMPLSCSVIDIESLPGNGCPYPSSPDSQCSVKISEGTTFRAMYEQEISSTQSMSISRKYFLQSQVIPSPDFSIGCDSDSESTVSTANVREHPQVISRHFSHVRIHHCASCKKVILVNHRTVFARVSLG